MGRKHPAAPTFVFTGTPRQSRLGRQRAAPDERVVLVHVDRVVQATGMAVDLSGEDVLVLVPRDERIAAGKAALFTTTPVQFGEQVTVRATSIEPATVSTPRSKRPVERAGSSALQQRASRADMVVVGHVREVRGMQSERKPGTARSSRSLTTRITEHDPGWREAIIDVESVLKGRPATKRVIVRFPSSTDALFFDAPKLTVGQRGVFLLHRAPGSDAASAGHAAILTAPNTTDVQPPDAAAQVAELLQSGHPEKKRID